MSLTWRELKSYVECMTDDVLDLPVYIDVKTYGGHIHLGLPVHRRPTPGGATPDMTKYPTKYPK